MNSHSRLRLAAVLAAAAAIAFPALAEVSAETDPTGNYLRTIVSTNSSLRNLRIWTVTKIRPNYYPLNPQGDLNGDLWPLIAENPVDGRRPFVVWSRFTGSQFDLGWSRWTASGWTPIQWVEPAPAVPGDDLDPSVAFSGEGRPHLVWWRNENGVGRVYLSLFLVTRWMSAFPVSDAGIDSYDPVVTVLADGKIRVEYTTAAGRVVRLIAFTRPDTITDDVTPMDRFTITETTTSPEINR